MAALASLRATSFAYLWVCEKGWEGIRTLSDNSS